MAIKRITTNLIEDGSISTIDIANNAITAAKITDGNITTAKLADLNVTAGKLAGTLDLTGKTVTVATATTGDSDTSPASTAFVQQEIAALVDSSPSSLNTLNELAAALGDDASFSTTVTNSIATKLPLAGGTLTGALTINSGTANTGLTITSTDAASWLTMTDPTASLFFGNTGGEFALWTGGSEAMRVDGSGDVGIGVSPYANAKLTLGGSDSQGYSSVLMFDNNHTSGAEFFMLATDTAWSAGAGKFIMGHGAPASSNADVTIDSSGNVGIGTNSPAQKLHVSGNVTIDTDTNSKFTISDGGTDAITLYGGTGDELYIGANNAYRLRFKTDGNIVMDNGGSFGIGTSSPTVDLDVSGPSSSMVLPGTSGTTPKGFLRLGYNDRTWGGTEILMGVINDGNVGYASYLQAKVPTDYSVNRTFIINPQGGNLLVGKTISNANTNGMTVTTNDFMSYTNDSSDTGDRLLILNQHGRSSGALIEFRTQNSNVGTISLNSSGNMVYGGQSDYRLKENVNYTWSATAKLKQLKPCEFEWKSDNYDAVNQGFLAHEVASVVPQAVIGNKDGVDKDDNPSYQQLDNSALVPLLTKAIQEQQTIIESLTARIETLEG